MAGKRPRRKVHLKRVPRVLLVHEPPDGGVAQHVYWLARDLRRSGFEPEVAGPPDGMFRAEIGAAGVRYHDVGFSRARPRPDREIFAVGELIRLLIRGRFDLMHAHSSKAGVYGRLAASIAAVPAVYTPHCFAFIGPVSNRRKGAAITAEAALALVTRRIICVSESERLAALSAKVGKDTRLDVVLQGIPEPDATVTVDETVAAMRERGPVVGVVNVLRAQKRTDVFLDSIPHVWKREPTTQFVVVGSGPEHASLVQRARQLNLLDDKRFRFLSFQAPSVRYLNGLDVFVLPSDWEGLPIGLLEAQAAGVPQVATALAANREVVTEDTGLIVPNADPEALAAGIAQLVSSEMSRRDMAQASVDRHREFFVWDRMLRGIVETYRRSLAS